MLGKMFSHGSMLLLVGAAAMFATPGLGRAQHGGGHGGGGHFGGAHFSGARFGTARFGGYRGSFYRGGYHYGYHHDYPHRFYGYYPYFGGYYPSYYDAYPYVASSPTYDSGYPSVSTDPYPYDNPSLQPDLRDSGSYTSAYPYGYSATSPSADGSAISSPPSVATVQTDTAAHITARLPADAELWFDGSRTTSSGPVRKFQSPPLTPGHRYTYDVRARWNQNGQEMTQTQKVEVTAGADVNVDFPVAGMSAG